ncbi:hypothetical protein DSO57_1011792 [Entomophthora muscae]|uniref:Uncharacterized protein n=1 Tax=Entomophthora muscae TaxID=34485 RepID=A0ACC2THA0_9FUNG|nr:hypothetical protein DSO57_1011792 [Entomophthora muscae]
MFGPKDSRYIIQPHLYKDKYNYLTAYQVPVTPSVSLAWLPARITYCKQDYVHPAPWALVLCWALLTGPVVVGICYAPLATAPIRASLIPVGDYLSTESNGEPLGSVRNLSLPSPMMDSQTSLQQIQNLVSSLPSKSESRSSQPFRSTAKTTIPKPTAENSSIHQGTPSVLKSLPRLYVVLFKLQVGIVDWSKD